MAGATGGTLIGAVAVEGRAFLAPMAAYTSWPFRRICRRMGAALVTTEVFKARDLLRKIAATFHIIARRPDERPIAAQMLSADPGEAAEATAALGEMGFDLVDLNCGCPKRRIVSDGLGGGLMGSPGRIERVVAAMVQRSSVPVTVKLRAGPVRGEVTAVEAARRAEGAGASALCVHPRFSQGASSLPPDWSIIAGVKEAVSVPVIGNGGIRRAEDAVRMFAETRCDAVAVGQAAMGAPWIFRQIEGLLATGRMPPAPSHEEILGIVLEHYEGLVAHHGERGGTIMMRKQSCHYARHLRNGRSFNQAVLHASSTREFMAAVDYWLRGGYKRRPATRCSRTERPRRII